MSLYVKIRYDIHSGQKNVRPQTHGHNSVKPVQNFTGRFLGKFAVSWLLLSQYLVKH